MGIEDELLFIEKILRESGDLIMRSFGGRITTRQKKEKSQLVTELDIASERMLIASIAKYYPQSSIIAEESGFTKKSLRDVWIIDPIDGTSNFANGLPWFGVMVAHIVDDKAISSGIYLPVTDEMYLAEIGKGAYKNGKSFTVSSHDDLSLCLIAFGTDGSEKSMPLKNKANIFQHLIPQILNFRSTNSIVDYCYIVEGKLGGGITLESRIWDVAPIIPIAVEAGCLVSDIHGEEIRLVINENNIAKNFTLVLGCKLIHPKLITTINSV